MKMQEYLHYIVYGCVTILVITTITLIVFLLTPFYNVPKVVDNVLKAFDNAPKEVNALKPVNNAPKAVDNAPKAVDEPVKPQVPSFQSNLLSIKDKLRHFFTDNDKLTPDDINIIDNYNFDTSMPPHKDLVSWNMDPIVFNKFSSLGVKILRNLNKDPSGPMAERYSKITDNILQRITQIPIDKLKLLVRGHQDSLVTITTMAAMFQLIVDINTNKLKYHQLILDLIPEIPKFTRDPRSTLLSNASNIINLSTPRLLTNYINAPDDFIADTKSDNLKYFHNLINNVNNINDITSDVINIDGSAFKYDADKNLHVINYSNFLSNIGTHIYHSDLYAAVNTVLDIPGDYYKVVKKLTRILLHPRIKSNPVFDSLCMEAPQFNWLGLEGELGCYLIPSIGLGIIKTKDFMFSLRVPMPKLSNYCDLDVSDAGGCLLGRIQRRVIHFATGAATGSAGDTRRLGLITKGKTECFNRSDIEGINDDSRGYFIGRLVDRDTMFWKMKYRVKKFEVKELGVVNSSGIEAVYEVVNQGTDDLYFRWRGSDDRVEYSVDVEMFEEDGDYIKMAAETTGWFMWKMKVGDKEPLYLRKDWDVMTFEHDLKIYQVRELELENHFKVECNEKVILIGGPSTRVDDVVNHNGDNYRRDNRTMMYVKE